METLDEWMLRNDFVGDPLEDLNDCKNQIDKLDRECAELKSLCKKLIEVNEFYSDRGMYFFDDAFEKYCVVLSDDCTLDHKGVESHGGKRARLMQKDKLYQEIKGD